MLSELCENYVAPSDSRSTRALEKHVVVQGGYPNSPERLRYVGYQAAGRAARQSRAALSSSRSLQVHADGREIRRGDPARFPSS